MHITKHITHEQIKQRAQAQIDAGPIGYLARMIAAGGDATQMRIARAADVEIHALREAIIKLGGELRP